MLGFGYFGDESANFHGDDLVSVHYWFYWGFSFICEA